MKGYDFARGRPLVGLLTLSLIALTGCGGGPDAGSQAPSDQGATAASAPLSQEAQALVNQGNTAQRAGQYAETLGYYRDAMTLSGDHPVPQFGALMAATALGDSALADSLRAKLEVSSPDLLGMVSPGGAMAGGAGGGSGMSGNPHAGMGLPVPESGGQAGSASALPPGHPSVSGTRPDTIVLPDTVGTR